MADQISGDTPGTTVADNPATGHATPATGTPQNNGQPDGQTGHVDDIFKDIDPAKLPPELRPHLDSMVRKYREKTEKLSETVKSETAKAVEAYKQKAEFYDAFSQNEELVKLYNEFVQKTNAAQTQGDPNDPNAQFKEKLTELEVKVHQAEAKEMISAFIDAADEKGQKLHGNFDKYNTFAIGSIDRGGKSQQVSLLQAAIELAPGNTPQEKLANGYKAVDELFKSIREEGKKEGMGRLQTKAQNGSFAPSSVSAGSTAPRRPQNALEAIQFARQGLAVHKD